MSELKPCICGSDVEIVHIGNEFTKSRKSEIVCPKCHLSLSAKCIRQDFAWLDEKISERWNTRPLEDELRAENASLKEQVSILSRENARISILNYLSTCACEKMEVKLDTLRKMLSVLATNLENVLDDGCGNCPVDEQAISDARKMLEE